MRMAVENPDKRMIMRVNKKPVWPTGNWTDSSIFSDERRIKESWSRSQSLLPLPDLSRKIEGDSARRVHKIGRPPVFKIALLRFVQAPIVQNTAVLMCYLQPRASDHAICSFKTFKASLRSCGFWAHLFVACHFSHFVAWQLGRTLLAAGDRWCTAGLCNAV